MNRNVHQLKLPELLPLGSSDDECWAAAQTMVKVIEAEEDFDQHTWIIQTSPSVTVYYHPKHLAVADSGHWYTCRKIFSGGDAS